MFPTRPRNTWNGSAKFDNVYNTVRFGVNYHFGRGVDSLK